MRKLSFLVLTVITALWSVPSAKAGSASPKAVALSLLRQARKDMAAGSCAKAIDKLHRGYRTHRHYVFPMLEGICLLRMDRPLEAKAMLLEARSVGAGQMAARHKRLIASKLKAVATRLKYDKISIQTVPPSGVRIELDGTDMGTSPLTEPLVVNRGSHSLTASAPGRKSVTMTIEAQGGTTRTLTVRLTRQAPARNTDHAARADAGPARTSPARTSGSSSGHLPPSGSNGQGSDATTKHPSALSRGLFWGGIAGMALGTTLVATGAVTLALAGKDAGSEHNAPYRRVRYDDDSRSGIAFTAVGASILLGGAAALITSFLLPADKEQDAPTALPTIEMSGKRITIGFSGRF